MCSADSFTPWHKNLHWVLYKMTESKISHPWLAEGEEKPDNEGKIKCPSLFLASTDSACDVRKTHRQSMCGIQHVPGV